MREIKFRAWVTAKKESWLGADNYEDFDFTDRMRDVSSIHFPLGGRSGKDVTLLSKFDGDLYAEGWHCVKGEYDAEVELMQYTGLKDKNDVEIYEGDILKGVTSNCFSDSFQRYNEIIWGASGRWHAKGTTFDNLQEFINYNDVICEVAGNIHQNPELI
jgi:uncharacterized phage protein (TIGR01671 family)